MMAWETMKAGNWATVLLIPASQWLLDNFAREKVFFFPNPLNICATVRGVHHQVKLHVSTSVPWRRPPLGWASACVAASASLKRRDLAGTSPPFHSPQSSPAADILSLPHPAFSSSPFIELICTAFSIVATMPMHLPPVLPETNVAATWPVPTVPAIMAGLLPHVPPAMVSHIFLPMSSDAPSTALASSAPDVPTVSFSSAIASAFMPVS